MAWQRRIDGNDERGYTIAMNTCVACPCTVPHAPLLFTFFQSYADLLFLSASIVFPAVFFTLHRARSKLCIPTLGLHPLPSSMLPSKHLSRTPLVSERLLYFFEGRVKVSSCRFLCFRHSRRVEYCFNRCSGMVAHFDVLFHHIFCR